MSATIRGCAKLYEKYVAYAGIDVSSTEPPIYAYAGDINCDADHDVTFSNLFARLELTCDVVDLLLIFWEERYSSTYQLERSNERIFSQVIHEIHAD